MCRTMLMHSDVIIRLVINEQISFRQLARLPHWALNEIIIDSQPEASQAILEAALSEVEDYRGYALRS